MSCAVKRPVEEWRPYGPDNPAHICPPSVTHNRYAAALTFAWGKGTSGVDPRWAAEPVSRLSDQNSIKLKLIIINLVSVTEK